MSGSGTGDRGVMELAGIEDFRSLAGQLTIASAIISAARNADEDGLYELFPMLLTFYYLLYFGFGNEHDSRVKLMLRDLEQRGRIVITDGSAFRSWEWGMAFVPEVVFPEFTAYVESMDAVVATQLEDALEECGFTGIPPGMIH